MVNKKYWKEEVGKKIKKNQSVIGYWTNKSSSLFLFSP